MLTADLKVYMEIQGTQNSQSNLENKESCKTHHSYYFLANQNRVVLTEG
jgi:hypothetical protein